MLWSSCRQLPTKILSRTFLMYLSSFPKYLIGFFMSLNYILQFLFNMIEEFSDNTTPAINSDNKSCSCFGFRIGIIGAQRIAYNTH